MLIIEIIALLLLFGREANSYHAFDDVVDVVAACSPAKNHQHSYMASWQVGSLSKLLF